MLKQLYRLIAALLIGATIVGCTSDLPGENPPAQGEVPIQLNGMLRALGELGDTEDGELIQTGYPLEAYRGAEVPFYLTARTTDAPVATFFINLPISVGDKNTNNPGRNALTGNVYYPLGNKPINLYASSKNVAENGNITLTSGTALANDVLLGVGTLENGETLKSGSAEDPVEFITFKHLMTRVDVRIEVDNAVENTKPQNMTMRFHRSGNAAPITNSGTYNIFTGGNSDGNAINSPSGEFSFSGITTSPKTYYLVPNGTNLTTYTGRIFSYLKIDDYVATTDDLNALKFSKAKLESTSEEVDFILKPGLAYDLVFKINRLKITEIKVTVKNWDTKQGETEWGYEPNIITLSTDEYDTGDISKMVLKYEHSEGQTYQYIGKTDFESSNNNYKVDFVSLPPNLSTLSGKLTADLYTEDGLLAEGVKINPSSDTGLAVDNLGKYGTKKRDDILEISTPLQFALMINDPAKADETNYELMGDIDMNGTSVKVTPQVFPESSVLDGKGFAILNLYIDGNGLFTENKGHLKNFRIASGVITGNGSGTIGSICQTNSGTIEAVVNQSNVQAVTGQTIAGGIAGTNESGGTIIATVNSGNVLGVSSVVGSAVGGIVGENKNPNTGAIRACLNVGMLNKNTTHLGGIIGTSVDGTSSPIVIDGFWLTGTARKAQASNGELAVGNSPANGVDAESADLASSVIRNANTMNMLNTALSGYPWRYELDEDRFSWPIAVANP